MKQKEQKVHSTTGGISLSDGEINRNWCSFYVLIYIFIKWRVIVKNKNKVLRADRKVCMTFTFFGGFADGC